MSEYVGYVQGGLHAHPGSMSRCDDGMHQYLEVHSRLEAITSWDGWEGHFDLGSSLEKDSLNESVLCSYCAVYAVECGLQSGCRRCIWDGRGGRGYLTLASLSGSPEAVVDVKLVDPSCTCKAIKGAVTKLRLPTASVRGNLLKLRSQTDCMRTSHNPQCIKMGGSVRATCRTAHVSSEVTLCVSGLCRGDGNALAGTVTQDTTGPHYKYSDDPFLSPYSNLTKRSYALSKESGRKAARWIREEYPKLFLHRPDEPFIECFQPKQQYEEGVEVDVDTLVGVVARGEVANAITVYRLCKDKNIFLPDDVLQDLLELLCFYNEEEQVEGWRTVRQSSATARKTWKDNSLAEEVFASLTSRGPAAYCALIRGMAHYLQVDRAWQLYQECQQKGIPLDTGTHNALIRVASFLRDASDLRWQLVQELLCGMAERGVCPDLGTLNATLAALAQVSGWRQARDISLKVLMEFHQLGIKPSLASYYYLLTIHCRDRGPRSDILVGILDQMEGQSFTLQDPKDTSFFVTAMEVARNHLKSLKVAERVESLLHQGTNHLFIGDSYKESVYYRHYFALSCSSLPIDEFMQVYDKLVPHIYTPEPGIMQEVLQAIQTSGALHYLPQLWSDMVLFDHCSRDKLVGLMLTTLTHHQPSPDDLMLTERLVTIAKDIWCRVQAQDPTRRNKVTWTGTMLGCVVEVVVRCGEYQTALEVLREATAAPQAVLGVLPAQSLTALLSAALHRKDADTAVAVVLYAQDAGHQETGQMAQQVHSSLALSHHHLASLASALGRDVYLPHDTPATSSAPAT
ncbi:protein PTCD3 homolog, mitochondrial-like [Portunus trituberculatus]|uniref:protein PTCD3 homolog, mitochondrial-like n=1 Tax=Portunus trituberculatus TaxID=210409 RepID=UPI001E1CE745|nr:protein PTCD3 homolog, mitochondrial-like [Portunus trituberculatus]